MRIGSNKSSSVGAVWGFCSGPTSVSSAVGEEGHLGDLAIRIVAHFGGQEPLWKCEKSGNKKKKEKRNKADGRSGSGGGDEEAKGHINPCQPGPNYLSPCANKHSAGQPVGGGGEGGGGAWRVRSARAASDAAAWPPSLFLLSPLFGPSAHYSSHRGRSTATPSTSRYLRQRRSRREKSSFSSALSISFSAAFPLSGKFCCRRCCFIWILDKSVIYPIEYSITKTVNSCSSSIHYKEIMKSRSARATSLLPLCSGTSSQA